MTRDPLSTRSLASLAAVLLIGALDLSIRAPACSAQEVGEVTVYAGDEDQPAPTDRLSLDLGPNKSAVAPDGSVYIADYSKNHVYRVFVDGTVVVAAGTGAAGAGPDQGIATQIDLDGPWGLDVDAAGTVYFVEGGFSDAATPPTARIRRLDPSTGQLATVGRVDWAVEVRVVAHDLLLVAAKDGESEAPDGGVWRLDPQTQEATKILEEIDGEPIDAEAIASALDGRVYVVATRSESAAITPFVTYAEVCALELDPPFACDTVQRQADFGAPVGPQLDEVAFDPEVPDCYLPHYLSVPPPKRAYVVDAEVDSTGVLHLLHVQAQAQFKSFQRYGGYYPMVYRWHPGQALATRVFGKTLVSPDDCAALNGDGPIADGTPASDGFRFFAPGFGLGPDGDLFLSEQTIAAGGIPAKFRSYRIAGVVPGSRIHLPRACGDGLDNDGDGWTDYPDDPQCSNSVDAKEGRAGCGLGFELALPLSAVCALVRRRSRRRAAPCPDLVDHRLEEASQRVVHRLLPRTP